MIILDTNLLVRFFTRDDEKLASKARHLLLSRKKLRIPDVVFPELEYVLSGLYDADRESVADVYKFLLACDHIFCNPVIGKALEIFMETKLDMADCMIAAEAVRSRTRLATFDKGLIKSAKVKIYEL